MSSSTHITPDVLRRWRARELDAAEMLRVSDHFESCAECRDAVADPVCVAATVDALHRHMALAEDDHLTSEDLVAWVDGTLNGEPAARAREHLAACARCRADESDLRQLATEFRTASRGPSGIRASSAARFRWAAFATAAAAVALLVWMPREPRSQASSPMAEAPSTPQEPPAPTVVALRDGGGSVRVLADGTIDGLPDEWVGPVAALLTPEGLVAPPRARALARSVDVERGGSATASDTVQLVFPVSRVVVDDRPVFRWIGPANAVFEVAVFDEAFNPIAESARLNSFHWQPPRSLPAGQPLTWKVTRIEADGTGAAFPRPPMPPAVLLVAPAADRHAIAEARRTGSRLAVAAAQWRAGLLHEAAAELALLATENPDSSLARRLAEASAAEASTLAPLRNPG